MTRCPKCRTRLPTASAVEAAYWGVQEVLDGALGTEEDDGAGAGIVADVWLVVEQRDAALKTVAGLTQELAALRGEPAVRFEQ